MWLQFIAGLLLSIIILFVPSGLQLHAAGIPRHLVLPFAPIISVAEFSVVGTALGLAGCKVSGWHLIVLILVISAAIFAARKVRVSSKAREKTLSLHSILNQGMYVCFALFVTMLLYVLPLDGPDSFAQLFDNGYHLNLISAYINSGRFSILQATLFPSDMLSPFGDLAFYPAAWHIIAAIVGSSIHSTAALAENVINVAFVALVFPLGIYSIVQLLFGDRSRVHICGAVCTVAFTAFPWGFLVYGPLYSNLAAFALLPAAMSCFMRCIDARDKSTLVAIFITSVVTLACSQPNSIFAAIVILTPYCTTRIYQAVIGKGKTKKVALAASAIFLLSVAVIWMSCRNLSLFRQVVNYPWEPYTGSFFQAAIDYLDLGYRNTTAQVLLAFIVMTGIVRSLASRSHRWLVFPYIYFGLAYAVGGAINGGWLFGSTLTGYWYNDIDRVAASAVIAMIPLATYGLEGVASICEDIAGSRWARSKRGVLFSSTIVFFIFVTYLPNFILAGKGDIQTAFGQRYERFNALASEKFLTDEEIRFLEKCKEEAGDNLVANFPYDGSAFAYSLTGLNTLYRHFFPESEHDFQLIQNNINEIADSDEVRSAVDTMGIRYVVLLDVTDNENGDIGDSSIYIPFSDDPANPDGEWGGLVSISDETPGFELVLSEGDMRLYRVV